MAEELKPVIVGPPAYASPDPATSAGGLLPVEERPANAQVLSEDYGATEKQTQTIDSYPSTTSENLGGVESASDKPREEWNKTDWETQAANYDLAKSGTKAEIQQRVEDYEAEIAEDKKMEESEWVDEINAVENADDLSSIRERYGLAQAQFAGAQEAFDAKQAEFDAPPADNG